ncbi:SprT-like domain-containing protein [Malonomonas rubra]|uniref:SprT-like domain-containing protein n=1 Tax=Malonomonas rubra TaxID=57040 RepID=UPI0026EE7BD5|nr:SprT-like domain-containing protein [Malonomonas rubra]
MTVASLAQELGLWEEICENIHCFSGRKSRRLIDRLATLPIQRSRATRRLGSYVTRNGRPFCIRLQFAQEPENLKQTLLHEIAHACDHFSTRFAIRFRRAHGPSWQAWAKALGTSVKSCGRSEALDQLHRQRLKLVAVCQNCGAEFHRVRRLNQGRKYVHPSCGGPLRLL